LGEEEPLLGYDSIAVTDNLTLLYCRRYLHEVASAEAERAKVQDDGFAVILIELSGLGEINNEDSYAAGDTAIKSAAKALQAAAVRCGGSACRYSGSRLALLAPGLGETDAREVAREVCDALPDALDARSGVAAWRSGESGDDVITRARASLTVPA
jgi:diguanylate cyclase (GGDEF)-like protein